jgi:pimeloyl-ACP methyl ester carboxylesterase
MWDVNVPALSAAHRLILWEPRGHARSDSPEDPARVSFARWALDLRDVLDHLRIRRAHVGGLSLGAGIATRFTLRFPGRVRSLLITNSSSASGLPLSVDNLVLRAQSIKITLEQGMDAMAEFAMRANPNLVERLRIDPGRGPSSTRSTGASPRSVTPTRCARCWRWTTSPPSCRGSGCRPCSSVATAIRRYRR